jgi:putative ABC transport system substrate-binding protein
MLGVDLVELPVNSTEEIEPRVRAHAERPHCGLIVVPSTFAFTHRDAIIAAVAKCSVPAIYGISEMVRRGGLLSYGPDITAQWRAAAGHVDRILRGATPATLPVELSPKIGLTINLNTARALGLSVSPALLARAEQVE